MGGARPPERAAIVAQAPGTLDPVLLAALREAGAGAPTVEAVLPQLDVEAEHRYVVRCVLQRHGCTPPHPDVVGAASGRFEIASYFDLEAPARPVRISLPVDLSAAALRKSPRSVAFVLSRQLRAQMSRIGKAKDLIDGRLSKGKDFDLGEICSLSIPILTLVAFIVLFIFLVLLNLIFWWLPFVKICFPLPAPRPGT